MAVRTVQGTAGNWTFTMPDQITLSQSGTSDLALDGGANPLIIDVRLNADLLFGGSGYHGIISIEMDDLPGGDSTPDVGNGLRGPIQIRLHNELGFPINNPPGANNTMAVFLAGKSDVFANPAVPPDDPFHTLYTHFHGVDAADFPGLTLSRQVGPFVGANPGDPDNSPNWLGLDGTIAPGTQTWGPFTFHRRDTDQEDDASLNIIFFDGALDPAAVAKLREQWDFVNNPPTLSVADVSTAEGNANPGGTLNFVATLSKPAPVPVTVTAGVRPGPDAATSATATADYTPISDQPITFAAGETSKTIPVTLLGDTTVEPDETFTFFLSNPTAPVTLAKATAIGTITNDDAQPNPSPNPDPNPNPGSGTGTPPSPPTVQLAGTEGDDLLRGTPGDDSIAALGGNDTIFPLGGVDFVDGGAGLDTAAFLGVKKSFAFTGLVNGRITVNGPEGNDGLVNVERVTFTDGRYEIDASGNAGKVWRVYDATLGREPDLGGLRNWHEALSAGVPLQTIITGFINSPEFTSKYGNTSNPDFIRLLYQNVLDRDPSAQEVQGWVDALGRGASRSEVVQGFAESPENVQRSAPAIGKGLWIGDSQAAVVARIYDTTLDRRPDEAGLKNWADALKGGLSLNQLADSFTGSPEFKSKYGTLNNQAFVELLYNNVLDRASDPGGLQSWTNALNGGTPRSQVVLSFSESPEHVAKLAPVIDDGIWVS